MAGVKVESPFDLIGIPGVLERRLRHQQVAMILVGRFGCRILYLHLNEVPWRRFLKRPFGRIVNPVEVGFQVFKYNPRIKAQRLHVSLPGGGSATK
jgi:hypothetical protein